MCGILALVSSEPRKDLGELAAEGVNLMISRGQDGFGIVGHNHGEQTLGYDVRQLNGSVTIPQTPATHVVAQTRYSTVGKDSAESRLGALQPFITQQGRVVSHNGQLWDMLRLEARLRAIESDQSWVRRSDSDVETLARALEVGIRGQGSVKDRVFDAVQKIGDSSSQIYTGGAFSAIMLIPNEGLLAFRDQGAYHPFFMAECEKTGIIGFASETVPFQHLNSIRGTAFKTRKVEPGEAIFVEALITSQQYGEGIERCCTMNGTYLQNAAGKLMTGNLSVLKGRTNIGEILYDEHPIIITNNTRFIGVPDSGRTVATGYARAASIDQQVYGITLTEELLRNRLVSLRAFITQLKGRQKTIRKKFLFSESEFKGIDAVYIEDSLVRGDTLKYLIKKTREFGARSVHVRVGQPPIRYGCPMGGTDTADPTQLIAYNDKPIDQIREEIDADSLEYISVEGRRRATKTPHGCMGCSTGDYGKDVSHAQLFEFAKLRVIN